MSYPDELRSIAATLAEWFQNKQRSDEEIRGALQDHLRVAYNFGFAEATLRQASMSTMPAPAEESEDVPMVMGVVDSMLYRAPAAAGPDDRLPRFTMSYDSTAHTIGVLYERTVPDDVRMIVLERLTKEVAGGQHFLSVQQMVDAYRVIVTEELEDLIRMGVLFRGALGLSGWEFDPRPIQKED